MTPANRRRRQLDEIRAAIEDGDAVRACVLAADHLAEFPADDEVRNVVAGVAGADARYR